MNNYTINKNDSLWTIAKNAYGKKITSDADIQKAVNKIVEANKIKNPNLIYAGDSIKLPDAKSIFGKSEKTSHKKDKNKKADESTGKNVENNSSNADIFSDFNNWQNLHAANMLACNDGKYDYDTYCKMSEEISCTFDFMEGKDANNEQSYDEQTLKLGQGEVKTKDSNEDGKVSWEEYFSNEIAASVNEYKEKVQNNTMDEDKAIENLTGAYVQAQTVFKIIDSQMGNEDGFVDANEFQNYYKYLNDHAMKTREDAKLGEIHIDDVTNYPEFLANQVDSSIADTTSIEEMFKKELNPTTLCSLYIPS